MKYIVHIFLLLFLIFSVPRVYAGKLFQHPTQMQDGRLSWEIHTATYDTFDEDMNHPCRSTILGIGCYDTSIVPVPRDCGYGGQCSVYDSNKQHAGVDYDHPNHSHNQEGDSRDSHCVLDEIYATNDGIVIHTVKLGDKDHGHGNTVVIRHDNVVGYGTVYSSYSHLKEVLVSEDDEVSRGQRIGIIGGTATIDGIPKEYGWLDHLHFEIKNSPGPEKVGCPKGKYFGYMPGNPDDFGYHNPLDFIGKVAINYPQLYEFFHIYKKSVFDTVDIAWYPSDKS